jgi:hypothetical protein
MVRYSGRAYLVPLTHGVSSTVLEQLLVVRNAIFAVDEAGAEVLSAIVLRRGDEAIPGLTNVSHHGPRSSGSCWKDNPESWRGELIRTLPL